MRSPQRTPLGSRWVRGDGTHLLSSMVTARGRPAGNLRKQGPQALTRLNVDRLQVIEAS